MRRILRTIMNMFGGSRRGGAHGTTTTTHSHSHGRSGGLGGLLRRFLR